VRIDKCMAVGCFSVSNQQFVGLPTNPGASMRGTKAPGHENVHSFIWSSEFVISRYFMMTSFFVETNEPASRR
jgi:hypothetical protein